MKAEHRKELETNALADKVGQIITGAKQGPSRGFLFYAVIAIVAAVGIFLIYRWYATSSTRVGTMWFKLEDGSRDFIEDLAKSAPNENPGKAARFQLAYEFLWVRGIKLLGARPLEAKRFIEEAEAYYTKLAESTKGDAVFEPEALYGLAVIEETRAIDNRDNLASAIDKYRAVVKVNEKSAFAQLAQQRIDDLENPEKNRDIQKFYQDMQSHLRQFERHMIPPGIDPKDLPPKDFMPKDVEK